MTEKSDEPESAKRVVDMRDALSEDIDLLGASVVRLKQNQEVEGQEAIDELEARYLRLRQDYAAWQESMSVAAKSDASTGTDSAVESEPMESKKVREQAQEAVEAARDQLMSSYQNIRSYLTNQDTQAGLKRHAIELQASIAHSVERMNETLNRTLRKRTQDRRDNNRSS